jgi:hypothetical protein
MGLTPYPYQLVTYAYATVGYQLVTSMSTPDFPLQTDNIAPTPSAFSAQCSAVRSRPACDRAGRGKEGEITEIELSASIQFGVSCVFTCVDCTVFQGISRFWNDSSEVSRSGPGIDTNEPLVSSSGCPTRAISGQLLRASQPSAVSGDLYPPTQTIRSGCHHKTGPA